MVKPNGCSLRRKPGFCVGFSARIKGVLIHTEFAEIRDSLSACSKYISNPEKLLNWC